MSDLKSKTDIPFSGQRDVIISPLVHHDDIADIQRDRRTRALVAIHGMLPYQNPRDIDGEEIPILYVALEFAENASYWGGNGVKVMIPSEFTAQDLSRALGEQVVVCDAVPEQLFRNGIVLTEDSKVYLLTPHSLN